MDLIDENQNRSAQSSQESTFSPLPAPAAASASEVVVESGPVIYNDAADEEEDEEEDACVSAMELLGGNGPFLLMLSPYRFCFLSCSCSVKYLIFLDFNYQHKT